MTIRTTLTAAFAAAALGAIALPAAAGSMVTIGTRPWQGIVDPSTFTTSADYANGWATVLAANPTAPAGYGDATITDWNGYVSNQSANGGTNSNIAFYDLVTFTVGADQAGTWSFQVGPDFGKGGTLIVDGAALQTKTYDMWWGGGNNYGNDWMTLKGSADLGVGTHTVQVYGFEDCCDGGTGAQYLAPGSTTYQDFVTTAGGVPEPVTWALMIGGFGGVGAMLRRRRALGAVAA